MVPRFDEQQAGESKVVGIQREYVWPRPKADRFIESLLHGLPVPGIFLVKEPSGLFLKAAAEVVLTPARLKEDETMAKRVVEVLLDGLDRRRFPWNQQGREPIEAEHGATVLASAALMATRRIGTSRRHNDKERQEEEVKAALEASGLKNDNTCTIHALSDAQLEENSAPKAY